MKMFKWTIVIILFIYSPSVLTGSKHSVPVNLSLVPCSEGPTSEDCRGLFSSWLAGSIDQRVVPSVSVGIVSGDKLVFHDEYNSDGNTRFGIASLTKTFTALLIMQLVGEGRFGLDDPVTRFLPGVIIEKEELGSRPVTIRHLLSHTSGMPSSGETAFGFLDGRVIVFPEQEFPAGERYIYSNDGYKILKCLLEEVTGRSFPELLDSRIFVPLEMASSTGKFANGSGGIITTLNDLANYTMMLIQRGRFKSRSIISEELFREMLMPVSKIPGEKDYYIALGWEVVSAGGAVKSFYKDGLWFGAASGLKVFPGRTAGFLFLSNPPVHNSKEFLTWRKNLTWKLKCLIQKNI